ncbi:MAG: UDP-N-acetylmuramate--L-alanine ligase [Chloroflexi bacterium]|nr:UDP-N-acetylmuramate--L-alanine ligase [Chloroflexota bacterium]OJV94594.1 MAG: UDP-N-acetylmuramate--L-alanine ligase [Chloroflexi bacterium 54-19]
MTDTHTLEDLDLTRIHLLGIGGAGQNALADLLVDMGYSLSGSDLKLSATTEALARRGVTVYEGQRAENLNNVTVVVTTAAANENNPEIQEARRKGLPVLQNAEMVGLLLNQKRLLSVAGTHGKTTTTGLVAFLLEKAGLDPTFYIGGVSTDLGVAGKAGKGEYAALESDEYARRFLNYRPEAAVITNVEPDHLDYYGTWEALQAAFATFAGNIRPGGQLYICADDAGAVALKETAQTGAEIFTYGLGPADWQATEVQPNAKGGHDFSLKFRGDVLGTVELGLAGVHNVRNATGALAMVLTAAPQVTPEIFIKLAGQYRGTARRFELKGEAEGVTVIDDYAHHPTEIRATLAAARARFGPRRLVALFQPHTYTRTKALVDEFAGAFDEADLVALMEIFPARETDTLGVSTGDILDRMGHGGKLAEPLTHANAASTLNALMREGDVLLTLGAGDVWKVGEQVLKARAGKQGL